MKRALGAHLETMAPALYVHQRLKDTTVGGGGGDHDPLRTHEWSIFTAVEEWPPWEQPREELDIGVPVANGVYYFNRHYHPKVRFYHRRMA